MSFDIVQVLNIGVCSVSRSWLMENLTKGIVFTPNVDHFVRLQKDRLFYRAYKNADFILMDSQVVFFLLNMRQKKIIEKISGVDFFPDFCRYHIHNREMKFFFLGGLDDAVHCAAERMNREAGRRMIVGSYSGEKGFENDEAECVKVISLIKESRATVLAVGIGSPGQERWIDRYRPMLNTVDLFFAVGGTFDVLSGKVKRAPVWMQNTGLEWLYRLLQEPRRLFTRYFVTDIRFFYYFLLERLTIYKNPFTD